MLIYTIPLGSKGDMSDLSVRILVRTAHSKGQRKRDQQFTLEAVGRALRGIKGPCAPGRGENCTVLGGKWPCWGRELEQLLTESFSGGASGEEPACRRRRRKRCMFDPWVGKIPRRRKWQPAPVFLPGESPWTEEPRVPQSIALQRVGQT